MHFTSVRLVPFNKSQLTLNFHQGILHKDFTAGGTAGVATGGAAVPAAIACSVAQVNYFNFYLTIYYLPITIIKKKH